MVVQLRRRVPLLLTGGKHHPERQLASRSTAHGGTGAIARPDRHTHGAHPLVSFRATGPVARCHTRRGATWPQPEALARTALAAPRVRALTAHHEASVRARREARLPRSALPPTQAQPVLRPSTQRRSTGARCAHAELRAATVTSTCPVSQAPESQSLGSRACSTGQPNAQASKCTAGTRGLQTNCRIFVSRCSQNMMRGGTKETSFSTKGWRQTQPPTRAAPRRLAL